MSLIKIICINSNGGGPKKEFTLNIKDLKNTSSLKNSIYSRLEDEEDIKEITINGRKYLGFEDIPSNELKNGSSMTVIIDRKINVDVYVNKQGQTTKPYSIECPRMDTSEEFGKRVQDRLPYNSGVVELSSNGRYLSNGTSLAKQNIHNGSKIHSTVRATGG